MSITEEDVSQGFERALAELRSTHQIYALPDGEIWLLYFRAASDEGPRCYRWDYGKAHIEQLKSSYAKHILPQLRTARSRSQVVLACCRAPWVLKIAEIALDSLPN